MPGTNNHNITMYPNSTMNMHNDNNNQIGEEDDDVATGGAGENVGNHGDAGVMNGGGGNNGGVEVVHPNASLYVPLQELPPNPGGSDQLTLSFHGEVYVFDAVSPEKVQAVLLLLGGYEVPSGIPTMGSGSMNQRGSGDYPGRSNQPQRAASLSRFREKRKERNFDKKIRYNVRKEVALRMQRKKGQFTSSKANSDDAGSASSDWNGTTGSQEEKETTCMHCGISSKSTPMMRRGPAGPRTLCNACGLKWANKGVLRDLGKVTTLAVHDPSFKAIEQSDVEAHDSDAVPTVTAIAYSIGDNSAETAET